MRLNFDTLFSKYMTDPWSPKLSTVEKILATISLVAFTILTVGLIFPLTAHLRNRKIDPIEQSGNERLKAIVRRIETIIPKTLFAHTQGTIRADKMGFNVGEYHKQFPAITPAERYAVRDKTIGDLEGLFGRSFDELANNFSDEISLMKLREALPLVRLFTTGHEEFHPTDGRELIGRFDVLAVPAKMNYDAHWQPQENFNHFFIHHGAAINIGESATARDFGDYSSKGKLDESKYIGDMARIFENMLAAQEKMGITDAVWFPFGMGAFLRHLPKNDAAYNDAQKLYQLREKIASAFVSAALCHPEMKIHLCLPTAGDGEESTQNHNAFVRALAEVKEEIGNRISLYINVDATELAQKLAEQKGAGKVSLANGANRNMIGNHWFADRALTAIDENIHRRSVLAAALALVLNEGCKSPIKEKDALKARVLKHGGAVEPLFTKAD